MKERRIIDLSFVDFIMIAGGFTMIALALGRIADALDRAHPKTTTPTVVLGVHAEPTPTPESDK